MFKCFSVFTILTILTISEICIGRTFADRCLQLHKEKKLDNATASMAKYWLTDLQSKVADECLQLHGGAGPDIYNLTSAY